MEVSKRLLTSIFSSQLLRSTAVYEFVSSVQAPHTSHRASCWDDTQRVVVPDHDESRRNLKQVCYHAYRRWSPLIELRHIRCCSIVYRWKWTDGDKKIKNAITSNSRALNHLSLKEARSPGINTAPHSTLTSHEEKSSLKNWVQRAFIQ